MESAHQKKVRESRQLIERPSQSVTKRAEEHYKELSKGHASENRKETGFDSWTDKKKQGGKDTELGKMCKPKESHTVLKNSCTHTKSEKDCIPVFLSLIVKAHLNT